ncbi:MAG: DUF1569 domain-containing protein [Bacteroidetes bacterium]|nr:DUF1569 domain-containing protein [Bacteroidota bacterium]
MAVKNLFDPVVKKEIIDRINQLTTSTSPLWGKMTVSQMLAHLQVPIGVALGTHTVKGNWLMRLIMPLFKKKLYDDTPWKKSLPTDKTFITSGTEKDFQLEKMHLLDMVERFSEKSIVSEQHPIFGKLTREQWSKATWKHIDHHLRQFGV